MFSSSQQCPQKNFDVMGWLNNGHGQADTRPILDAVIDALKAEGVTTFGATGYCFGARYAVDLAIDNVTKAIVIAHPSLLNVPDDFEVCLAFPYNKGGALISI
jgi:dienelactone hydrolase